MFKVSREPTFTHVVSVQVPIDGGHREESFKATYRVLDTKTTNDFDLETEHGSRRFLEAAIVKLDDLIDETDRPLSYSNEVRDQLLGQPHVRAALARAYFAAIGKAKAGN
jgi:hypothetical protein